LKSAGDHGFSISSEELLEMCKRQDQEALRVLFQRYERPVYSLLYRMLSSHEDAEEALADVFVKVWKGAPKFKGKAKFTTWLYRIASNTARDCLRSRKTRQEVSTEDTLLNEVQATGTDADRTDPVKAAAASEQKSEIVRALAQLSEEDRLLIVLYHFQERDYREITEITGIEPNNLKVKLLRARQRLKKVCSVMEGGVGENELQRSANKPSGLQQGSAEWA